MTEREKQPARQLERQTEITQVAESQEQFPPSQNAGNQTVR